MLRPAADAVADLTDDRPVARTVDPLVGTVDHVLGIAPVGSIVDLGETLPIVGPTLAPVVDGLGLETGVDLGGVVAPAAGIVDGAIADVGTVVDHVPDVVSTLPAPVGDVPLGDGPLGDLPLGDLPIGGLIPSLPTLPGTGAPGVGGSGLPLPGGPGGPVGLAPGDDAPRSDPVAVTITAARDADLEGQLVPTAILATARPSVPTVTVSVPLATPVAGPAADGVAVGTAGHGGLPTGPGSSLPAVPAAPAPNGASGAGSAGGSTGGQPTAADSEHLGTIALAVGATSSATDVTLPASVVADHDVAPD